ncbi:MAG: AAA family ATPase [Parashewanella sp.]
MKPELLSMTAFGPFADTQQIQFTDFSENALFLINGPTGAGKTTILDGICFALYGRSTGNEREASQMRCDMAAEETITEVTFEFSLGDYRYRVRRVPEQERKKKSGDGFTQQKPEAQLYRIDAKGEETLLVEVKVSEATAEIEQLLGLDVEQFRQVMVLPQGKFRELLMADSKAREKIFGQLFQTHIYRRIEDKLKQKASDVRQQVQAQRNRRQGVLQSAKVESDEQLKQQLDDLAPALEQAAKIKNKTHQSLILLAEQKQVAQQLSQKFAQQQQAVADKASLTEQAQYIQSLQHQLAQANLAADILPLKNSYLQRQQEHQLLEEQQSLAEQKTNQAKQDKKQLQLVLAKVPELELQKLEFQHQAQTLEQLRPLLVDIEQISEQLAKATQTKAKVAVKHASCTEKLQQLLADKQQKQAQLPELQTLAASQLQLQTRLNQQQQLLENYRQFEQLQSQSDQLERQLTDEKAKGAQLRAEYDQAKKYHQQLQLTWHQGQAAVLAQSLQLGSPCPVCGSAEHPMPANFNSQTPTEAQLQQANQQEVSAQEKLTTARSDYKLLVQQQQHIEQQKQPLADLLGASLSSPISVCEQEAQQLQKDFLTAQQAAQQLTAIQKQIDELSNAEQLQVNNKDQLRVELEQIDKQQLEQQTILNQAKQRIPADIHDISQLDIQINVLHNKMASTSKRLEEITNQQTQVNELLAASTATLASLNKQLDSSHKKLVIEEKEFIAALKAANFDDTSQLDNAVLLEQQQTQIKAEVERYQQSCAVNLAKLNELNEQLVDKTEPDLGEIDQNYHQQQVIYQQQESVWQQLQSQQSQLSQIQQQLVELDNSSAELEKKYAVVGTLADVANGQTGNKISLNRFVLSVLLDDVLIDASKRLHLMSKGRYRLLRKEQRAKGNKASGLELEVEDGYTSKVRDVATLSGGESFMAALSLALALSEVVQAYAGGIKLDTLFIDEGFGSLDQDSLELAVQTLMDLQSTGRMIGVISHVTEMKEQLDQRIDVIKTSQGSRIALILE